MALEQTRMNGRAMETPLSWYWRLQEEGQLMVDPPFQRGAVWTPAQREAWIITLLEDLPRPSIFLNESMRGEGAFGDRAVVIDGRQRLESIFAFMNDELLVRGEKWSDQDIVFQRGFKMIPMPVILTQFKTERECMELYVRLLRCGTAHTESEIAKAEAMLAEG